jgi:hypothetical protein
VARVEAVLDARLDARCAGYVGILGRADLRTRSEVIEGHSLTLELRAIDVSASPWLTVADREGGVYEMRVNDDASGGD